MSVDRPLFTEIKIGPKTAVNRIALNAMECNDADSHGNPSELTYERYKKAFRGNAGLVLMEAISVIDDSKGRLNQLIGTRDNQAALTKLIETLRQENDKTLLLIQLTHSGELSSSEFSRKVCHGMSSGWIYSWWIVSPGTMTDGWDYRPSRCLLDISFNSLIFL